MHICRKVLWLLFILGILLLNTSYAAMFIFTMTVPDIDNEKKTYKENTYDDYIESLNNVWLGFLNASYDYMDPWSSRYFVTIIKIAFSFFTAIVIMNLLSMYTKSSFFVFADSF